MKEAPFDKRDTQLLPAAGSCLDCPKRTGHNKLLFADVRQDACTDPSCYGAKVNAHVATALAAKPELVQISTAYGQRQEGSSTLPRNKYVAIRSEKPKGKEEASRPEFKTCKFTTEAIVTEGGEKGELRKVCASPNCSVHHPKKQPTKVDASLKAEQEKRRREEALAQAIGLRVLSAVIEAVPVRLMRRDLLFVVERLVTMLDERRVAVILRQHGIGKVKESDAVSKLLTAFLRKADEGVLGRVLVEIAILHATQSSTGGSQALHDAAGHYKVDVEAITAKVKLEFASKEKARSSKKPPTKPQIKSSKKPAAA